MVPLLLHVALDRVPIAISAGMIVATVAIDTAASIANNVNVTVLANDEAAAAAPLSNANVVTDAVANNASAKNAASNDAAGNDRFESDTMGYAINNQGISIPKCN